MVSAPGQNLRRALFLDRIIRLARVTVCASLNGSTAQIEGNEECPGMSPFLACGDSAVNTETYFSPTKLCRCAG